MLVVPGHLIGYAGEVVLCADDAVVGGIEAELDSLLWVSMTCSQEGLRVSDTTYITNLGLCDVRDKLMIC